MLKTLHVQDFAIIEDLTVSFNDKMTVLTGQTGAGKSLILDCIGLLLGDRADTDMIRYSKEKAIVEGVFTYEKESVSALLQNYRIPEKNKQLTIRREIFNNSKSSIKVNQVSLSLTQLKTLMSYLADMHVQHDAFKMINPENYLAFIDKYANVDDLYNEYQLSLLKYQEALKKYHHLLKQDKELTTKIDTLKYQYAELIHADLKVNEENELEENILKLANFDKIFNALASAKELLENEYFSIDKIYETHQVISKIKNYDENYEKISQSLLDCYYDLEEKLQKIKYDLEKMDFDPQVLNEMETRLQELKNIQKKYQKDIVELIQYQDEIKMTIDLSENFDQVIQDVFLNVKKTFEQVVKHATSLSEKRKKIAKDLEKQLMSECYDLDLENTIVNIHFYDVDLTDVLNSQVFFDTGIDQVEFLISLNKGEPVKPLHKVASGGELSRILLGFKAIFAKKENFSLMIFDEIDSGVSGSTASKMASKMKDISENTQVLCITHLPQVASIANNHIYIYKEELSGLTYTKIANLDYEGRIKELAIMLSGDKLSKGALENAKELLLNANISSE